MLLYHTFSDGNRLYLKQINLFAHKRLVVEPSPYLDITDLGAWMRIVSKKAKKLSSTKYFL